MEKITEEKLTNSVIQKPEVYIECLTFNDGTSLDLSKNDIIVFVGSNNSGKSQVLKDIVSMMKNKSTKKRIVSDVTVLRCNDLTEYISHNRIPDDRGQYWLMSDCAYTLEQYKSFWESGDLPEYMYEYFVNILNTEQRLLTSKNSHSYEVGKQLPTNPIQKLYADKIAERKIAELFSKAFGEEIVVDKFSGNTIPLRVGTRPSKDENEEIDDNSYISKLRQLPILEKQGDGMRSFTSILLDVFVGEFSITLIDEPEAFLHPPQARALGNILAKNSKSKHQMFISTHSEDFLKGLLDVENENVKIIRINRKNNVNHMNILSNEDIKNIWSNPLLRHSNILSGLFHSKVVICESDSDCRFYKALADAICEIENKTIPDILFTHCGGKQRIKDIIYALKPLGVNVVAICDIDILNDKKVVENLIISAGMKWSDIESDWIVINNFVKNKRPQLALADVKKEIEAQFDAINENATVMSNETTKNIQKIIKQSTAWADIKTIGKYYFSGNIFTSFESIVSKCEENGIFILEVGELEEFYKPLSNLHGPEWANEVLQLDLNDNTILVEAKNFVKKLLEQTGNALATKNV